MDTYRDILTNGEFSGKIFETGSHGENVVTQEAIDYVENQLERKNASASYQKEMASALLTTASRRKDAIDLVQEKNLDQGAGFEAGIDTIRHFSIMGAGAGAIAGATGLGVSAIPGAIIGGIGGAIIGISRAGEAAANATEEYADKMIDAGKLIADNKIDLNSFESFKNTLITASEEFAQYNDEFLQQMYEASSELKGLGDAYNAAAEAQRAAARLNAQQTMSGNQTYDSLSNQEQQIITEAMAAQTIEDGAVYDKTMAEVQDYDEEKLNEAFAELNNSIEYVNGKFYEIDADTGKRTEVEDGYDKTYMQNTVAADLMSTQITEIGSALAESLSSANFNDDQLAALQMYTSNAQVEIENEMQSYAEYLSKQGIDSIDEFIEALNNGTISVNGFADATDKIISASTFGELAAIKNEADAGDKNEVERKETEEVYKKQLDSITESEAEKYELDFDEIIAQAEALAEAFDLDEIAARDLAIQNQRMNKGVDDLSEN